MIVTRKANIVKTSKTADGGFDFKKKSLLLTEKRNTNSVRILPIKRKNVYVF